MLSALVKSNLLHFTRRSHVSIQCGFTNHGRTIDSDLSRLPIVPEFTGKHVLASCNRIHTTFPIETKQEDMIGLFEAEEFNMQWTNGDVYEVIGIDKIFEDRIWENDLRITHD